MKLQDMKLVDHCAGRKMTDQFAGHKVQDMKLQDMNVTDQKWRQGVKLLEKKYSFNRDIIAKCANF